MNLFGVWIHISINNANLYTAIYEFLIRKCRNDLHFLLDQKIVAKTKLVKLSKSCILSLKRYNANNPFDLKFYIIKRCPNDSSVAKTPQKVLSGKSNTSNFVHNEFLT